MPAEELLKITLGGKKGGVFAETIVCLAPAGALRFLTLGLISG